MVAHGRVRNGVVALDVGVRLPEGQEVTVVAHIAVPPDAGVKGARSHSVLDIVTVSLGSMLHPLTSEDDRLVEMLEGRT
jgi:hypothetical protein